MPLSPYYKPLYDDPAFDRPLAQSAFMQQPLPDDNGTDNTGGAPVIPSPAVDPSSTSTANPSLPAVTDTGASSDNPQSAMTQSKPSIYDYLQNYNQGAAKSAIDNANKLAVSPDDIQKSQDRQNLLSLQQGLSTATSQIGNVGGKVQDNDFAKYLENQVQGEKNNLKQRQDAANSARDQLTQILQNEGSVKNQQYQDQLKPLELQAEQNKIAQQGLQNQLSQQEIEKGKVLQQVTELNAKNQAEMSDPNSGASQSTRQLLKRVGINVPDDMPGSQAKELLEQGVKVKNVEETVAGRRDAAQARAEQTALLKGDKQTKQFNDDLVKADKWGDPTAESNKKEFAADLRRTKAADRGLGLIYDANGNVKNLMPQEFEMAAQELNTLLGGPNVASIVHGFLPKTKGMSLAQIQSYLTDNPTSADNQKFSQWFGEVMSHQKNIAEASLKKTQIQRLHTYDYLRKQNPDAFDKMLDIKGISPEEYESNDPNVEVTMTDPKTGQKTTQVMPLSKTKDGSAHSNSSSSSGKIDISSLPVTKF